MAMPSPRKLHKRSAPSRAGSDFSLSTVYSSSSTLVHEERLSTSSVTTPSKAWGIKALNHLGLKRMKSMTFGKEKGKDAVGSKEEQPPILPYTTSPDPFVVDNISESMDRGRGPPIEDREELELLPECIPQLRRRTPSTNALCQPKRTTQCERVKDMRLTSTPDLCLKSNRDSLEGMTDPFYLETLLNEFPKPPVHVPGEYAPRAPVNPKVRRNNSNFSLPTSRAYPGRARLQAKHCNGATAPRNTHYPREESWMTRSDSGIPFGL